MWVMTTTPNPWARSRRISGSQRGQSGAWKYRDHGLFICFAPTANPRYAASVVIDHGLGGAHAAAPIAKDVLTFLSDPAKVRGRLVELEKGWGGDIPTRMAAEAARWKAARAAVALPPIPAGGQPPAAGTDNKDGAATPASRPTG